MADPKGIVIVLPAQDADRVEDSDFDIVPKLGSWVWVVGCDFEEYDQTKSFDDGRPKRKYNENGNGIKERQTICCVTHIGSNFVLLESLHGETVRLHFDKLIAHTRPAKDANEYFKQRSEQAQDRANVAMERVRELTMLLGVSESAKLPEVAGISQAMVRSDGKNDAAKDYKTSLIKAKDDQLPALFEKIKAELSWAGWWMKAELLPMRATLGQMQKVIKKIESRIFNVALYAGIEEEIVEVAKGKPAPATEKIRVYQRRLYMDEESLISYEAGGLQFDDIKDFDAWMAKTENRDRLLPFPRCIVAFRVRRYRAEHEYNGKSLGDFINFCFEAAERDRLNMKTYLYMRNGDCLYRLATEIDFGSELYPDDVTFDLGTGQAYATSDGKTVISQGEFEQLCVKYEIDKKDYRWKLACVKFGFRAYRREYPKLKAEWDQEYAKWEKAKSELEKEYREERKKVEAIRGAWKKADDAWFTKNDNKPRPIEPHTKWPTRPDAPPQPIEPDDPRQHGWGWHYDGERHEPSNPRESWFPLDQKNVRLDDANQALRDQVDAHNRVVLVLQGLLDRSPVWHPHPPWKLWDQGGFEAALVLVKDQSRSLDTHEPRPDFEAYCQRLLSELKDDSVVMGQRLAFGKREADRYNAKAGKYEPQKKIYYPTYNDGPPRIGKADEWKKKGGKMKAAVFKWKRQSERERRIKTKVHLPRQGWYQTKIDYVRDEYDDKIIVPVDELFNLSGYKAGDFKQFFANIHTRKDYVQWAPLLFMAEDWLAEQEGRTKKPKHDKFEDKDKEEGDGDEEIDLVGEAEKPDEASMDEIDDSDDSTDDDVDDVDDADDADDADDDDAGEENDVNDE